MTMGKLSGFTFVLLASFLLGSCAGDKKSE
jgi:hypothetical protein